MDKAFTYMLIFFGGGLGCLSRFLIDGVDLNPFSVANVLACALMGISYAMFNYQVLADHKFFHCFINMGFLGGLSTFTPLAIFSLVTTDHNILLAIATIMGLLAAYSLVTIIAYYAGAYVLKHFMNKHRRMSLLARYRFIVQYKILVPRYKAIREKAEELYASGLNLKDKKPLPGVFEEKRVTLRNEAYDYIKILMGFTEMYKQAVERDRCRPHTLEDMLVDAVAKGDLGTPEKPIETIKPQLEFINQLVFDISPNLKSAPKH